MKTEQGDRLFWIWLSRRLGEGSKWYPILLERFGAPYDIFRADDEELAALMPEMSEKDRAKLCNKSLDEAYEILSVCRRSGYSLLCYDDKRYPLSYRSLLDPPLLMYYRGTLPDFQNRLLIALVGTRKMSEYGRRMTYKIAYELAHAGAVIVSGMARGIDGVASCAALAAKGSTVAILGSGLDVPYPPEHAGFQKILEQQAVVMTEYAPGSRPERHHFPHRNRLISGLCQGTVVIDADDRSGALLTADHALYQGRDIFAVPANVGDPNASGPNRLIREGVRVALCADDILNQYSLLYRHSIDATTSASLGKRSDYDGEMLARMGVYSYTIDGEKHERTTPKSNGRKQVKNEKPVTEQPKAAVQPDHSAQMLATLGERERRVFDGIPMDRPVTIDGLQVLGYNTGELLAALSMLEVMGLIQTLPGGLYCRA